MYRIRRAAMPMAALLLAGVLTPAVSTPAMADTDVTITGTALSGGDPIDGLQVVFANTSAYVRADDLDDSGQSMDGAALEVSEGAFSLTVPAGRPFYLVLHSYRTGDAETTWVGAGGERSVAYPALTPFTAEADLEVGALTPITLSRLTVTTDLPADDFALERLDGYIVDSQTLESAKTTATFTGVVPGRYRVSVAGSKGASTTKPVVTVTEGEDATVSAPQTKLATISGTVLTSKGDALRNVSVMAVGPGGRELAERTVTNKSGKYSLKVLKAGTYKVTYSGATGTSASAYLDGAPKKFTLDTGAQRTLKTVKLTKGGVVSGSVKVGSDWAAVTLLKYGYALSASDGTWSQSGGVATFRTRGVKSGTYTLVVQRSNGKYTKKRHTVTTGKVTKVGRVAASDTPVKVTGKVQYVKDGFVSFSSKPHPSGRLATMAFDWTSSTGAYSLKVAPGTWSVQAAGDTGKVFRATQSPRRVTVTKTRTYNPPTSQLNDQVSGTVSFRDTPIAGTYLRTRERPNATELDYFAKRFSFDGDSSSSGSYKGHWGRSMPANSKIEVLEDGLLAGPYYFAATPATVSQKSDVKAFTLTLKGGM